MCGIYGCIGNVSLKKAYECINKIRHRGPDALQVRELTGATLAHARLSILDTTEMANQPMSDESGRYCIVYNGEVYNFLELREELESKGYKFKTDCDTEVVLYAYIEWGEKFQYKCNGMWAIAIWDSMEKSLFLSRDRFGVKPLYYYSQNGNFYFASEMKAFFPIMNERKINYRIFEQKNYFGYEATTECCIKDISKIQAGWCGYYNGEELKVHKWWNTLDNLITVPQSYDEQVEYLRELFLDACKIRMRSDVPIGTALSGGVDSSAVVGAMSYISKTGAKRINGSWQHAFVASMPNTINDETEYARIAAQYIGVDINEVIINGKITEDDLMDYMYTCEDPYITSPIPFMQTYKSISDSGIKVTIDGHGADEMFAGYSFDIPYVIRDSVSEDEMREIWKTFNDMSLRESKLEYDKFIKYAESLEDVEIKHDDIQYKNFDILNKRLFNQTHDTTLPTLLRCYDRYSMGNGVEIRMPFMDYRIVCFAFSIPWSSKVRDGYNKKIVRDMASPLMSDKIMYRKDKIGFNSPMSEWIRGDLREFILDTIHSKEFYECEMINPLDITIRVNELLEKCTIDYASGEGIWTCMIPFFWKKAMKL